MKIFISWSKEPSKQVAEALAEWLPDVIQSLKPWVSREIPAGSRWNTEIADELSSTKFGIICVTKANQHEPWLQFEAGALAKTLDEQTHVCPYLIGMSEGELSGPLVAFQSVRADEAGTKKLVQDINAAMAASGHANLPEAQVNKAFDRSWGELQTKLNDLTESSGTTIAKIPSVPEMVVEILAISRDLNRQLNTVDDVVDFQRTYQRQIKSPQRKLEVISRVFTISGDKEKTDNFKPLLESLDLPSAEVKLISEGPSLFDEDTNVVYEATATTSRMLRYVLAVVEKLAKSRGLVVMTV
jgi:hypothetical protein